jgi:hypothetical protein
MCANTCQHVPTKRHWLVRTRLWGRINPLKQCPSRLLPRHEMALPENGKKMGVLYPTSRYIKWFIMVYHFISSDLSVQFWERFPVRTKPKSVPQNEELPGLHGGCLPCWMQIHQPRTAADRSECPSVEMAWKKSAFYPVKSKSLLTIGTGKSRLILTGGW